MLALPPFGRVGRQQATSSVFYIPSSPPLSLTLPCPRLTETSNLGNGVIYLQCSGEREEEEDEEEEEEEEDGGGEGEKEGCVM